MFLKFLKPPRFETNVVARFPTKIGPDAKAPPLTPQREAYIREQGIELFKQFRRKQIVYRISMGATAALVAVALWKLAALKKTEMALNPRKLRPLC